MILKNELTSQLEVERAEEQELRNIISNLEKELELSKIQQDKLLLAVQQKDQLIGEINAKEEAHSTFVS